MAPLHPAVAATRGAVRACLGTPGGLVLVACSGGADSLALAAATAFEAPRAGWTAGLVTVDHQLQPNSADRAAAVAAWAGEVALSPAIVETVDVAGRPGGPEAAARQARYQALVRAASIHGATTVLLGHTRDDQAETVLLAMLRGSGPRGIAGMPTVRDVDGVAFVRPLLDISRTQTRAACAALGLAVWDDPHNTDPVFGRARARILLDTLSRDLGPAVVTNLARTAHLAALDAAALDDLAAGARVAATDEDGRLRVADLADLAAAVRARVLHTWARWLGVPGSALSHRHVAALDALVVDWHGQGAVHLPGAITVVRRDKTLLRQGGPTDCSPMRVRRGGG
jgi:tRNA(Ile)-lysidine synthase